MRVLGSSVLAFEAIVVLLATALTASATDVGTAAAWISGFVLMVLLIVGAGLLGRPYGVAFGWVLQALVLASAIFAGWTMLVVGGIFVVLWFIAIRTGRRVDALRQAAQSDAGMTPPGETDPA